MAGRFDALVTIDRDAPEVEQHHRASALGS
jgi:hypothetical protein